MEANCHVENLHIPVLTGTYYDLQQFDFSFKDISILDIESKEFSKYIKKYQPFVEDDNPLSCIKYLEKKFTSSYDKFYAIVKSNPCVNYNYADLYTVFKILLIIYPSDLQIEHLIEYHGADMGATISSWDKRQTGRFPGKPLYDSGTPDEVNKFLPLVFERVNQPNYTSYIIENYVTSFDASHTRFQFINLCICLESVINGTTELNFRLRRCIAILCGENDITSDWIFKNLNKIYQLRSKIVHGEKHDFQKIDEYLPFLKAIVSRTIIELLIHNIATTEILNETVTKIGFGERDKISKDWKSYVLNLLVFTDSNYTQLK